MVAAAWIAPLTSRAGPPFLTDDPEPTDTGHWEIYAPLLEAEGRSVNYEGSAGAEINYGIANNMQLTVGLPVAFAHDAAGSHWGTGDIAVSLKLRFFHDEDAGLSVAVFPGMTLPTASSGMGNRKVTGLLPMWIQKDAGAWSLFGGGGYALNPGDGNRNFWTGGIAVSRHVNDKLLVGVEADRQGADGRDANGATSLGIGVIYQFRAPFRLLASCGPTFEDGGGSTGFHAFVALGLDF